jgi:hypothetical protein
MRRVITKPDFIFNAKEGALSLSFVQGKPFVRSLNEGNATDTSMWRKIHQGPDGPGVIEGPIEITFYDYSRYIRAAGSKEGPEYPDIPSQKVFDFNQWGSFNGTTNLPAFNCMPTNVVSATVRTTHSQSGVFEWILLGNVNGVYRIDSATNLSDGWTPRLIFTNSYGLFTFTNQATLTNEFYRVLKIGP